MATHPGAQRQGKDSQLARAAGAAAALVLAAAVLAGAASVHAGDVEHPTEGKILPGKVSVLGEAKVRRWSAQRFSVEVPLEWPLIEEQTGRAFTWVHLRSGQKLSAAEAQVARGDDWAKAQRLVSTRFIIEPAPSLKIGARRNMRLRGRRDEAARDGYVDSGGITLPLASSPDGRYAFRLLLAVPGFDPTTGRATVTPEAHYFFSTCRPANALRYTYHVTYDRSALQGQAAAEQDAVFKRMIGSLETTRDDRLSPPGTVDCRIVKR